ncbi:hypothetical protein RSOLAG22IIIB_08739 [Rhizoctonia solani]|uniref:DNA 3'-5' helicase n=1 Tax=Rhizoctonia solani TaxID=456999 RepID=A0A0K6FUY6_9AGAM|nr:hypothetical protein RSOLAG22IIIB_08739 [Rhizoctonia solani]
MNDEIDDYDPIIFTNDELRQLDAVASPTRPLPPGKPNYGSDAYFRYYKVRLEREVEEITKTYDWQLDSAVPSHAGRDVFILAGTGCGKTLPFVANCFLDEKMFVFLVSPLNALVSQQAKTFKAWGVEAFAVNSTTRYPELYKDIHARRYQVIISSVEAFTDTTRLLPVVKSPSLAKRGRQLVILDEARWMDRWRKNFRPKYGTVGDLRLLITHEVPWIATTATASEATRKIIKASLRFQDDALVVNLGNRKLNLAYSVHRMKRAASFIPEILDYFPSKTELPGYTLIFIQPRRVGQLVLYLFRQHVAPKIRYQIQIYHTFRSDHTNEIIALAFEIKGGFRVIICSVKINGNTILERL